MDNVYEHFKQQSEYKSYLIEELTLKDIKLYAQYISRTQYKANVWSSNFAYLWAHTNSNNLKIYKALVDNLLVTFILTNRGRLFMPCLPYGKGNVEKIVTVLIKCADFCWRWNKKTNYTHMSVVNPINSCQLEYLKQSKIFNIYFKPEQLSGLERHFSIKKIVDLSGKEFASIRNKINRFKREYPHAIIRRYKDSDYEAVMELGKIWEKQSGKKYNRILDGFYFGSIVKNYKALDHLIIVIELDGKIIGMNSGGILPTGEAWGCLTKFDKNYNGLSEMLIVSIINEIYRINPRVETIDVGSDLGSKGLAFSKERYRPVYNYERFCLFYKLR